MNAGIRLGVSGGQGADVIRKGPQCVLGTNVLFVSAGGYTVLNSIIVLCTVYMSYVYFYTRTYGMQILQNKKE